MTFALAYWILMLIWFVFGCWSNWPVSKASIGPMGGSVLMFVLLVLLGWAVFGAPLHS